MERVYLDYAAATPIDKRVASVMQKWTKSAWANASSLHKEGEAAKDILEQARIDIARILHCKKSEVIFTSGGTESANLTILGIVEAIKKKWKKKKKEILPHVVTSTIEHPAVLEPIKNLLKKGEIEASFVFPNKEGIINPQSITRELKENTILVCIMHSNNEIGTIQPIRKLKKAIGSRPFLLVDASQSVCFEDVSTERLGADILILDGVKMYGPRGAGILVVKSGTEIAPVLFGGGPENGLRSGTENVISAIGLAKALKICEQTREKESARLKKLRDYAIKKILATFPNASLNGSLENRLPNNINICFGSKSQGVTLGPGSSKVTPWDSEFAIIKLDTLGFAVSAASACHNLSLENSSYVIEALGKPECASSSLRFTLGRATKKSDLDKLIKVL